MHKILLPVDGSETSLKAVKEVISIARQYKSHVMILSVIPDRAVIGVGKRVDAYRQMRLAQENMMEAEKVAYQDLHKEIMKDFVAQDIPVEAKVRVGVIDEEILAQAEEGKVNLIVIGNRGLSGTKKFFMGSVSERVVAKAQCSVLVVKN